MSQGRKVKARYYALLSTKVISGILVVMQILGLLPALTWLGSPSLVTPDHLFKLLIKVAALLFFFSIYRWSSSQLKASQSSQKNALPLEPSSPPAGTADLKIFKSGTAMAIYSAAILMATVVSYTVWPTPYRYDHFSTSSGSSFPIRINRFTGETEMLRGVNGWMVVGKPSARSEPESPNVSQPQPKQVAHVSGATSELTVEQAFEILRSRHPDFESIRTDKKYGRWLSSQRPDIRKLAESSDPYEAIRLVDLYKKDLAAGRVR